MCLLKENPADIASRGIDPKCLPDCILWWQGPPWLRLETCSWPKAESSCDEASNEVKAEQKSVSIFNLFTHTSNDVIQGLFEHSSSLTKIIRIFAYCQRFIKNCKKIASCQESSISSPHINTTSLSFSETKAAEETIIRWVQSIYFQEEIQSIKKQISLPPKSPLLSLHPFIDEHGLVRVGGRLQNSQLRFNSKHPIILPSQHSISELLIKEQHITHLHAGPTLLAHVLRQSHWIVGTTKAVPIKAVGDLTTDSFIAALRRFSARRGASRHIYSDNGTNFVGARRKLDEIRKLWLSLPTNDAIYLLLLIQIFNRLALYSTLITTFWSSRGASFNLQPQRSLGVATEYQTGLLEEVELRIYLFLITSQEMAGRTTKLEGR
ncbi:integrase catalytic domain-containing protein [Trichonephila clavipes]|nr:integrase catalytic domain-containing protein [Trichonephila clavipes]